MSRLQKCLNYIWPAVDKARYGWWTSGHVPAKAPAWADNAPPPPIQDVIATSIFCMGVPNLMLRVLGKEIPHLGDLNYDGGTVAYFGATGDDPNIPKRDGYFKIKGVERPFDLKVAKANPGTLIGRKYRTPSNTQDSRKGQGHGAVTLDNGRLVQSFDTGGGKPGLNAGATIEDSHAGWFYEVMILPEDWLGKDDGGGGGGGKLKNAAATIDETFRGMNYYSWVPFQPIGQMLREEAWGNIDAALACAVVEQEAGGKNIFGCDWGSRWTDVPPYCQVEVTKERVKALIANVAAGGGQNGVGLTQLTTIQFVKQAEAMGGAHLPRYQCRVGFRLLRDYIIGYGYLPALEAYNDGTPNRQGGGVKYSYEVAEKHDKWKRILAGTDYEMPPKAESPPKPPPAPPTEPKPIPRWERELNKLRERVEKLEAMNQRERIVSVPASTYLTTTGGVSVMDEQHGASSEGEPQEPQEKAPLPKREPVLTVAGVGSIIATLVYLAFGTEAASAVPVAALDEVGLWLSIVVPIILGLIQRQFVDSPATVEKKMRRARRK